MIFDANPLEILKDYLHATRANFGRAGIRVSPPRITPAELHLTIEQGPTGSRKLTAAELEERLRQSVETLPCFQETGLTLHIDAIPAAS